MNQKWSVLFSIETNNHNTGRNLTIDDAMKIFLSNNDENDRLIKRQSDTFKTCTRTVMQINLEKKTKKKTDSGTYLACVC